VVWPIADGLSGTVKGRASRLFVFIEWRFSWDPIELGYRQCICFSKGRRRTVLSCDRRRSEVLVRFSASRPPRR
jgi:hypothetical protein